MPKDVYIKTHSHLSYCIPDNMAGEEGAGLNYNQTGRERFSGEGGVSVSTNTDMCSQSDLLENTLNI